MQTGIPYPIPIIQPVERPKGTFDYTRVFKDLTDYVNQLNHALLTLDPIRTVGVSYTLALTDRVINVYATAGNVVITIPSPAVYPSGLPIWGDFVYEIKRLDASGNSVTVEAANGATIDGAGTKTMAQWDKLRLRPYALYGASVYSAWGLY